MWRADRTKAGTKILLATPTAAEGLGEDGEGGALLGVDLTKREARLQDGAVGIDDFQVTGQPLIVTFLRELKGIPGAGSQANNAVGNDLKS